MADRSPTENHPSVRPRAKAGLFRFSMAQFLVAVILMIIAYPFVLDLDNGDLIENVMVMVGLISAAMTVNRRDALVGFILVVPAAVGPWLNYFRPGLVPMWAITGTHPVFVA